MPLYKWHTLRHVDCATYALSLSLCCVALSLFLSLEPGVFSLSLPLFLSCFRALPRARLLSRQISLSSRLGPFSLPLTSSSSRASTASHLFDRDSDSIITSIGLQTLGSPHAVRSCKPTRAFTCRYLHPRVKNRAFLYTSVCGLMFDRVRIRSL